MKPFRYLLACYPALLVLAGNLLGDWWTCLNIVNSLVLMIGIETWLSKEDYTTEPLNDTTSNVVLIIQAILHTLCIGSLLYGVASHAITGWWIVAAAASTGLFAGQNGIVNAHELIHRKQLGFQLTGIWSLLIVNYGHFFIEHIRNHHKFVGTLRDPATARYGESIYKFWSRTITQQFISAWKLEAERLNKFGKSTISINNFVFTAVILQLLIITLIGWWIGLVGVVTYLLCSLVAILLLEYVNYIEHYGLVRVDDERVSGKHSWQSDMTFSRYTLIELSRHADHHFKAAKPYHTLVSFDDSPVLPGGYYAVFYKVLLPPLWFRTVHPIIDQLQKR